MSESTPTQYVYTAKSDPDAVHLIVGTLDKYARDWKIAYYGDVYAIGNLLLTWDGENDPVAHEVKITRGEPFNDYIPYTLTVNGESAHVSIDGAA